MTEEVNLIPQLELHSRNKYSSLVEGGGQTDSGCWILAAVGWLPSLRSPPLPLSREIPEIWRVWQERCGTASADTGDSPHWCPLYGHPKRPCSISVCPAHFISRSHPLSLQSLFVYFLLFFLSSVNETIDFTWLWVPPLSRPPFYALLSFLDSAQKEIWVMASKNSRGRKAEWEYW